MAKNLSFASLTATANDGALTYESSKGVELLIRSVTALNEADLKTAEQLLDLTADDSLSLSERMIAVDKILSMCSTDKAELARDLKKLPISARLEIFKLWQEETELGEASAS